MLNARAQVPLFIQSTVPASGMVITSSSSCWDLLLQDRGYLEVLCCFDFSCSLCFYVRNHDLELGHLITCISVPFVFQHCTGTGL